jgi:Na+/proline symporter
VVYLAVAVVGEVGWVQTQVTLQAAVTEPRGWGEVILMLDLLVVGALGNLPAQDLIQRFLCVRSAPAARRACFWAAGGYLVFGLFPIGMGLLATHVLPDTSTGVVMGIANKLLLGPWMVIFVLAVVSAVLSTIDGAILSPAGVLAQNLLPAGVRERWGTVPVNRAAVVLVALCSLATAFSGKAAYSLLEEAYSLMLVGLLVPLLGGLWFPRRPPSAAIASMLVGTGLWLPHLWLDEPEWLGQPWLQPLGLHLPLNLTITAIAAATFFVVGRNRPAAPSSANLQSRES